jgi:DNA-binding CsgD family transcriptional regulator
MNLLRPIDNTVETISYTGGEQFDSPYDQRTMALLALSHTPIEHQLYNAMLGETSSATERREHFSARRLMVLTGLRSSSTVRRGLSGLVEKLSIERCKPAVEGEGASIRESLYVIYSPEEIFSRRKAKGLPPYPKEIEVYEDNRAFGRAINRVANLSGLSRREAQVALCCAEGLSNSEIAAKLRVTEQTVKFHLRHIFIKFKVRRRAELVSRLLRQGEDPG